MGGVSAGTHDLDIYVEPDLNVFEMNLDERWHTARCGCSSLEASRMRPRSRPFRSECTHLKELRIMNKYHISLSIFPDDQKLIRLLIRNFFSPFLCSESRLDIDTPLAPDDYYK